SARDFSRSRPSARLRAAFQIWAMLPRAMAPFSPFRTGSPAWRRPSESASGSSGTMAAQPRRFESATARPTAAQAWRESVSLCSSRRRTRARLYYNPDVDDAAFLAALENGTLPSEQMTHAAHLRLALLCRGQPGRAREILLRYVEAIGAHQKYNE